MRKRSSSPRKASKETVRTGAASAHGALLNNLVHIFVDDQNLFYQIVNNEAGKSYRIDFGRLLLEICKDTSGKPRGVASAYIAGVIPDDDSFWKIADSQGFTVRRGFINRGGSKQDDAYLITDLVSTLYEQPGPSTAVLVAGDADYVPPLKKALSKGWRTEVAFVNRGISGTLQPVVHEFRTLNSSAFQYLGRRN